MFYNSETLVDFRSNYVTPLQQISEYGFRRYFQIY
jgi:hypothetical protein